MLGYLSFYCVGLIKLDSSPRIIFSLMFNDYITMDSNEAEIKELQSAQIPQSCSSFNNVI